MSIWTWLGGILHDIKIKVAPLIVGIIEAVKAAETSGILPAIATVLAPITKNLSVTINNLVQANINTQLAVWLGIEGLPANPTEAQELAFSNAVAVAYEGKKAAETVNGQVEQELGVQLYNIIVKTVGADKVAGTNVTANQIAGDIEEAYQDYVADQAAAAAAASDSAS